MIRVNILKICTKSILNLVLFCFFAFTALGQGCQISLDNISGPTDNGDGTCTYTATINVSFTNDNGQANNTLTFTLGGGTITSQSVFAGCDPCSGSYDITFVAPCGSTVTVEADYDGPGNSNCTVGPVDIPTTALPVNLVSFNSEYRNGMVFLTWATAWELNNAYFDIERSFDGKNFHSLDRVTGIGFSTEQVEYDYTDILHPDTEHAYYRLKQVDTDGLYAYSKVNYIKITEPSRNIDIYPNPITSGYALQIEGENLISAQLFNIYGALISTHNFDTAAEIHEIKILDKGKYLLTLEQKSGHTMTKIVQAY